ncbi:hypothetical protein H0H87_008582 [Tephrocybe sp. NHM501043]|nr:hypothetical protein H0H87_008582 [Tephrocybe sp. NHM501043]
MSLSSSPAARSPNPHSDSASLIESPSPTATVSLPLARSQPKTPTPPPTTGIQATQAQPLADIIGQTFPPFDHHTNIVSPFNEELNRDSAFEKELGLMLLNALLETHAWAAARPKHESSLAAQNIEKKIVSVMETEKEQGMSEYLSPLRLSSSLCAGIVGRQHSPSPFPPLSSLYLARLLLHVTLKKTMAPAIIDTDAPGSPEALLQSFAMIIFSEIGDKTFLIAAILAMRHPRLTVFLGAFLSLALMSLLSAALGHILPTLIPRTYTQLAASVLFLVFGAKMMKEAREMEGGNGKIQEEMREAQEEIEEDEEETAGKGGSIAMKDMESGGAAEGEAVEEIKKPAKSNAREGLRNFCNLFFGPVFVQAFILTFLGEWGDRSQIATIALGAAHVRSLSSDCSFIFTKIVSHRTCILWHLVLLSDIQLAPHSPCWEAATCPPKYL